MNWGQLARYVCAGAVMAALCSALLVATNAVIHPASSMGHGLVIGTTYFVSSAANYVVQKRAVFQTATPGSIRQMSIFMLFSATISAVVGQIGLSIEMHLDASLGFYANSSSNLKGIAGLCLATFIAAPLSFQISRRLVA
jgi:putative flippase GtrA